MGETAKREREREKQGAEKKVSINEIRGINKRTNKHMKKKVKDTIKTKELKTLYNIGVDTRIKLYVVKERCNRE
jgi:hypothetical protein